MERLTCPERPEPVSGMDCGLPVALSAMVNEAERFPLAAGVNVTLIVQVPFATSALPQVLVCVKSPALAPVRVIPVRVKLVLPVLVRVRD